MTEGSVEAGRLHLDAYIDTSGVTRGLQAKINAQLKNTRAKIKAEIDTRGSVGQAKAAAAQITRDAAAAARVKIKAEIDARSLKGAVKAAATEASKGAVIKFRAELDQTSVASLRAAVAAATTAQSVTVKVNADTSAADTSLDALRKRTSTPLPDYTDGLNKGLSATTRQAASAFTAVGRVPMLAGGFFMLGTAIVNVGAGLFAMAASATQAAAVLAVIPNLIGTIGQGLGVVIAGFSGIGDAISAVGEAEKSAASDAGAAAEAREAAAKRVAAAQESLGDAMRQAADSARQANEAVADANWALARSAESLRDAREALENAQYAAGKGPEERAERLEAAEEAVAQAQENATDAQDRLNKARIAARERIEDLNRELRLSAADEAAATFAVIKAQQDLEDARMDASSTEQERQAAEVALLQAQAGLERQKEYQEDLATTTAEANAEGVDGNEAVQSAQEALTDSVEAEKDAREALADTIEQNKRDARDAARSVRNAEEDVRDAIHAQGEAREAVADALRNQAAAAAASSRAIRNARAELADALADQAKGNDELSAAAQKAKDALDNLGPAGQRFVRFIISEVKPVLKDLRMSIQEALLPGVQAGVKGALPLLNAMKAPLVDTARRVGVFVRDTGKMLGSKAWQTDVTSIMGENNKALTRFMRAGRNMLNIFKDIAVVAGPTLLRPFSKWTEGLTKNWRESVKANRANGDLRDALENAAERAKVIGRVFRNVATAIWGIGKAALGSGDDLWGSLEGVTERWSKWANDPANQEVIQGFFEGAAGILARVGDALAGIIRLFTKLSDAGQGPLMAVLDAVNWLIDGMNSLADIPFIAEILGWAAAFGLLIGALTTLGGMVMGFAASVGTVFSTMSTGVGILRKVADGTYLATARLKVHAAYTKVMIGLTRTYGAVQAWWGGVTTRVTAMIARMRAGIAAYRAAMAGLTIQQKISATATMIWGRVTAAAAAIGRAFRLVALTMFGPWGLAIAAVVILIVALVKRFGGAGNALETLKKVAGKALDFIIEKGTQLYKWFAKHVFPKVILGAKMLWKAIDVASDYVNIAIDKMIVAAKWLWSKGIKPAFGAIRKALPPLWRGVKKAFSIIGDAVEVVAGIVMFLWKKVIKPSMPFIRKVIGVAAKAIGIYFKVLKVYISGVILYFKTLAKIIIWAVKNIIVPVIRFMVGAVKMWWSAVKTYAGFVMAIFRAVAKVLTWLWKTIVTPVFAGIRKVISLWWAGVKVYFNLVKTAIRALGSVFRWLWNSVVRPVFSFVRKALATLWNRVYKPIIGFLVRAIRGWGNIISWLWNKVVKPTFTLIQNAISFLYNKVAKPIFDTLKKAVEKVGGAFTWLWEKAVKPAFDNVKSKIETVWSFVSGIFTKMKTWAETTLPTAFTAMKDGINKAFRKMAELALIPVKFVVNTIYNNGIRKMIGFLPGVDEPDPVNTDDWTFKAKTGGIVPGFTPGRDVHRFTSPSGGTLDLSGGESVMRPEWTRLLGAERVERMNAAARKGSTALRNTVGTMFGGHGAHANGGIIARGAASLGRFFLGGVVPLIGANSISAHDLPYYETGATYAGDLNSPNDLASPSSPVVAWQTGTVGHTFKGYGDSHGRYGNHVVLNHSDGRNSWYAHLASIINGLGVGDVVRQGAMLGRVGATGNVKPPGTGAHLHFEVRGGAVSGGDGTDGTTVSPEQAKGEKKAGGWRDAYGTIKDMVTKFPGWLRELGNSEWGGYMKDTARSVADTVRNWINDKIPNSIEIPGPNIPLPDNPIPKFYDQGGEWKSGTLGMNMSGYTETVFTNRDMVNLSNALRQTAAHLRASLVGVSPVAGTGSGALVEKLEINALPKDVPGALASANYELRKIRRGGVHARRDAP